MRCKNRGGGLLHVRRRNSKTGNIARGQLALVVERAKKSEKGRRSIVTTPFQTVALTLVNES